MEPWIREIFDSEEEPRMERILYGWSGEEKWHIIARSGEYLLRRAEGSLYPKFRQVYEAMQPLRGVLGLPEALACGRSRDGKQAWSLLRYIPGEDMRFALPRLKPEEQYHLGMESGQLLRVIHSQQAPTDRSGDWAAFFNKKIDRKIAAWHEAGLSLPMQEEAFAFVERGRAHLSGRPVCLQHGDFHIGNMIRTPEGRCAAIDFNRCSYGDPWEEFDRIIWDWDASLPWAIGRIDGYFNGKEPPEAFWQLSSLYIVLGTISGLPWALTQNGEEARIAKRFFSEVADWYSGYTENVPRWYRRGL